MQSGEGAPTISLQLVPKMLAPLVSLWVPNAFVVSFKLETDENLLIVKARTSLNKYKHKVNFDPSLIIRSNFHFNLFVCFCLCFFFFFYQFQLVIANMLQSRKSRVVFVSPSTSFEISLTKDQMLAGTEIEEFIVNDVVIIIT